MRIILLLIIVVLVGLALSVQAAQANYSQVFQQYQEGLFYETDIGDLKAAEDRYRLVAKQSNHRELAAAALFRLGIIYEKTGKHEAAKESYRKIISDYSKNNKLVKQANSKLLSYHDKKKAKSPKNQVKPRPTSTPTITPVVPKTSSLPRVNAKNMLLTNKFGIGNSTSDFTDMNLILRYSISEELMVEGRINLEKQLYNGRAYYRAPSIVNFSIIYPYGGISLGNNLLGKSNSGYNAGIFMGLEYLIGGFVGLGLDAGLYIEKYSEHNSYFNVFYGKANVSLVLYF